MRTEGGHVVETAVEARAGFLDRAVLAVLVASTAVVVVALAMTYLGVVKLRLLYPSAPFGLTAA